MDDEKFKRLVEHRKAKRQEAIERRIAKDKAERDQTLISAINRVKDVARRDTWCTAHGNCFRASFGGNAESAAHRNKKYALWCEYREVGCEVFVELRLADGSRPDLIVCWNNGQIEIIEVAESEKEESLLLKEEKYPFPTRCVRC